MADLHRQEGRADTELSGGISGEGETFRAIRFDFHVPFAICDMFAGYGPPCHPLWPTVHRQSFSLKSG